MLQMNLKVLQQIKEQTKQTNLKKQKSEMLSSLEVKQKQPELL